MPVLGLEDASGNPGGMVIARLWGHLATHQPARRLEVEHGEHGFEQRGMHPFALTRGLTLQQGH